MPNSSPRPLPKATPETAHFWEGTGLGELRLQRCQSCNQSYFPPQPFCPACASSDIEVVRATGRGRLHTYVISHVPTPGFTAPHVLAVIELDEGPRMLSNLVGSVDPGIDMAVEVVFETFGDATLPLFRPQRDRSAE